MPVHDLLPGLVALHGNRAETLAEMLLGWLGRRPLDPLEQEVVLVQSNGMAEWFKMALARQSGVCAAARVELPSRFLWRTSRQVLGPEQVPRESPLDKLPLTWRLMALLPQGLQSPALAPLRGFVQGEEPERLLQLASRLADLFDQYQIYRPDWLLDWAAGRDVCRHPGGEKTLEDGQRWQAELWRLVLESLSPAERQATRPALHQRVLAHLRSGQPPVQPVARRVSVFGMSHMPLQLLELLSALADHSQVLLAVPNPCRFHWGDIMDGREWLRSTRQRQPEKNRPLASVDLEHMHLHAPTLLAAWGRQGRDFVRMLDAFDDVQATCERQQVQGLDFFDDEPVTPGTPMLAQLQRRIRDLLPSTPEHPGQPLPQPDPSVRFRIAHSPVRELEVLHDQLLEWFSQPPGGAPLSPREVVVMVPDIERFAPAIEAVFGQYPRGDARHIPYAIADLGAQASSPLIHAVHWLLGLPQARVRMSELVALLEVPALARRLGIDEASLPVLTRWMTGAGIRWGLTAEHRAGLGLEACGETHSLLFGVQRMLMGYACGADPVPLQAPVMPYDEVAGLEAELAGSLARLLQVLTDWWQQAQVAATPVQWAARARDLLAQCFDARTDAERQALQALTQALEDWLGACEQASFDVPVPLEVAREAWLHALRMPRLEQRFRAGGVTFCTLMPMRAIPFRVVCLLGMNDGDYPRRAPQADFDLMATAGMGRPGDRARRDEDRQLMLEALLSARDALYVSWCGRSVRDNSEQPPSVLVAQLRDEIDLLWGAGTAQGLTVSHPLQPFGRAYFDPASGLATYAHEWQPAALPPESSAVQDQPVFMPEAAMPVIDLRQLARFLRRPVGSFFRHRLQVHLDPPEAGWRDEELFGLDGLEHHRLLDQLLMQLSAELPPEDIAAHARAVVQRLRASGALPLAGVGVLEATQLQALLLAVLQAACGVRSGLLPDAPRLVVDLPLSGSQPGQSVHLRDAVAPLWQPAGSAQPAVHLMLTASAIANIGRRQPSPKPDRLIDAWLVSLSAAAMGRAVQVVVVGRNAVVRAPVLGQEVARAVLAQLLQTWCEGQCRPLPLPPAIALAWLQDRQVNEALRSAYEDATPTGVKPAARQDPALYRCYPTLQALLADGRFAQLADRVYGPLLDWVGQCQVQALPDPCPEEEAA